MAIGAVSGNYMNPYSMPARTGRGKSLGNDAFKSKVNSGYEVIQYPTTYIYCHQACPNPDMMMAVSKHWYEKYGAVPATISHDTLEFSAKPVNSKQAKQLAKEHCAFCPEIIMSDCYIGEVIDALTKSTVWFFWWD